MSKQSECRINVTYSVVDLGTMARDRYQIREKVNHNEAGPVK
ncbi:hypothetical protein [Bacillus sp. WMMC1349]|nr:hypothetical protein [Bacillus sp. WMMC1349]